ncbi:MAG: amidohydrolase family protein, partial [Syntrophomonadaceae bacterium]|nr:amidohydrolase family protein [Syntrophomonadaceae bacterium]
PTHINRHRGVFAQGKKLLQRGGNIDLTAGETAGYSVMESLKILIDEGYDISRVTVSSDAHGSTPAKTPADSGVNNIDQLFQDIKACVTENHLDLSAVIKTVTINPAKILKIYPQKGILAPGSDADILVLQENDLSIFRLMAKGQIVVENQNPIKKGRYEN